MEEYIVRVYNDKTEWRNKYNQYHRLDGPALEWHNGDKFWYQNGLNHRIDGPAIELLNGNKFWYKNGKYHRTDGPACEYSNGDKFWYLNGQLHRTDGPAIEEVNGEKCWYIEDIQYTEEGFKKKLNPIIELTVDEISKRLGFTVKIVGEN